MEVQTEKPTRVRVSVKFKVANGWRGTKSRDFPGKKRDQCYFFKYLPLIPILTNFFIPLITLIH